GSILRDLQASTRSKRNAAISRRGEVSPAKVCSQSSRFSPITSRFSPCRQMMSEVWTRASCTCAEITARSSASSAISLSGAFNAASSDIAVSMGEIYGSLRPPQQPAEPVSKPVDVGALQDRLRIAVSYDADQGAAEPLAGRHLVRRHADHVSQQWRRDGVDRIDPAG